jgi:hypothetical protein
MRKYVLPAIALCLLLALTPFLIGAGPPTDAPAEVSARYRIMMPIVRRTYPPFPGKPWLNPIDNPDGDGNYTVSWGAGTRATSYELEEQWQGGNWFKSYSGSATQVQLQNRPPGTYWYRCRAKNSWGHSQWSNLREVGVQGDPPSEISTPSSSYVDAGGKSVVKVVNDCPYVLRLDFAGPDPKVMELPKCDVCKVYSWIGPIFCPTENRPIREIQLEPGPYRVFVTVDDPTVRPYVGHWELQGNRRYFVCFYVVRQWTTKESSPMRQVVARSSCD